MGTLPSHTAIQTGDPRLYRQTFCKISGRKHLLGGWEILCTYCCCFVCLPSSHFTRCCREKLQSRPRHHLHSSSNGRAPNACVSRHLKPIFFSSRHTRLDGASAALVAEATLSIQMYNSSSAALHQKWVTNFAEAVDVPVPLIKNSLAASLSTKMKATALHGSCRFLMRCLHGFSGTSSLSRSSVFPCQPSSPRSASPSTLH